MGQQRDTMHVIGQKHLWVLLGVATLLQQTRQQGADTDDPFSATDDDPFAPPFGGSDDLYNNLYSTDCDGDLEYGCYYCGKFCGYNYTTTQQIGAEGGCTVMTCQNECGCSKGLFRSGNRKPTPSSLALALCTHPLESELYKRKLLKTNNPISNTSAFLPEALMPCSSTRQTWGTHASCLGATGHSVWLACGQVA